MNLNLRLVEAIVTGVLGLTFAGELGIKSLAIFVTMIALLHFRQLYSHHMNLTLYFFIGIYIT